MKSYRLSEVMMIDGSRYRGEIVHKDDNMVVLRLKHLPAEPKLRLYSNGIILIRELGWRRTRTLRQK